MTSRRVAVVTAADSSYFSLLQGLVASLHDRAPGGACRICVIDLGLTRDEMDWVEARADAVVPGRWDVKFPGRENAPRSLQGLTCRPFLPDYFSGADTYVWLDADTWVQDWGAVELYLRAAQDGSVGVVPEVDRAYRYHYDRGHALQWMHGCYREAFGNEMAALLGWHPILGAGGFAMRADSRGWEAWARRLSSGLRRTRRSVDQTSLNVAVYTGEVEAHFLPSEVNWMCNYALPAVEPASGLLVHPMLPHEPLGVIHLAGKPTKLGPVELRTTEGGMETRWLTYLGRER